MSITQNETLKYVQEIQQENGLDMYLTEMMKDRQQFLLEDQKKQFSNKITQSVEQIIEKNRSNYSKELWERLKSNILPEEEVQILFEGYKLKRQQQFKSYNQFIQVQVTDYIKQTFGKKQIPKTIIYLQYGQQSKLYMVVLALVSGLRKDVTHMIEIQNHSFSFKNSDKDKNSFFPLKNGNNSIQSTVNFCPSFGNEEFVIEMDFQDLKLNWGPCYELKYGLQTNQIVEIEIY